MTVSARSAERDPRPAPAHQKTLPKAGRVFPYTRARDVTPQRVQQTTAQQSGKHSIGMHRNGTESAHCRACSSALPRRPRRPRRPSALRSRPSVLRGRAPAPAPAPALRPSVRPALRFAIVGNNRNTPPPFPVDPRRLTWLRQGAVFRIALFRIVAAHGLPGRGRIAEWVTRWQRRRGNKEARGMWWDGGGEESEKII